MRTKILMIVFLAGLLPFAAPVAAQDDIQALYGKYSGTGVETTPDAQFFGFTDRDLDVEIGPDGDGFFVSWTTVIRDIRDPEPRRRESRLKFIPAGRAGYYREEGGTEPIDGGVLRWAHVAGDTLTVQVLALTDDGSYGLQTYRRTVRGDSMQLEFRSVADGEAQRIVTGSLSRN